MFIYGLSRKQCGVIFANIKSGKLVVADNFASWMYNHIADCKAFRDDAHIADVYSRMRTGLDAIFAGDFAAANEALNGAYDAYHVYFA